MGKYETKLVYEPYEKAVDKCVQIDSTKVVKEQVKVPYKKTIKVPKVIKTMETQTRYKCVTYKKPYQARVYQDCSAEPLPQVEDVECEGSSALAAAECPKVEAC